MFEQSNIVWHLHLSQSEPGSVLAMYFWPNLSLYVPINEVPMKKIRVLKLITLMSTRH